MVPLSGTVHHLSGPDMFTLTRCAVCVCVDVLLVFCWCVVGVFGCVLVCVVVWSRVCGRGVSHKLSRSQYTYTY